MKIWFDTEFIEDGKTIDLMSIGMIREDGATLYLENMNCDLSKASDWVKENVIPHLKMLGIPRKEMAQEIVKFAGNNPQFWAYYADYDWVVLCQLYGTMMDLPTTWPMFCMDLKQFCVMEGDPPLPKQNGVTHNALADAIWAKEAFEFLVDR